MFGGGVSTEAENRIFRSPFVRAVDTDCDVVVGRLLDQQELRSCSRVPWSYHRTDYDDHSHIGRDRTGRLHEGT